MVIAEPDIKIGNKEEPNVEKKLDNKEQPVATREPENLVLYVRKF